MLGLSAISELPISTLSTVSLNLGKITTSKIVVSDVPIRISLFSNHMSMSMLKEEAKEYIVLDDIGESIKLFNNGTNIILK